MTGHQIGYVRVSSVDQNLDRQLQGITLDKTFQEKASAKDANRPVLQQCLEFLREGDTLHVHSMDRLARNNIDLQQIVNDLTARGVTVRFHKEGLNFNGQEDSVGKLMLQIIGAVAEFERALIRERQKEGIAAAKRKGKQIGAKRKLTEAQVQEIRERADKGETKKALAQEFGISRQTLYDALGR